MTSVVLLLFYRLPLICSFPPCLQPDLNGSRTYSFLPSKHFWSSCQPPSDHSPLRPHPIYEPLHRFPLPSFPTLGPRGQPFLLVRPVLGPSFQPSLLLFRPFGLLLPIFQPVPHSIR